MAKNFDEDAYIHRIQTGPCFICEMIAGRLEGNHIIYLLVRINQTASALSYSLLGLSFLMFAVP